MEFRLLGPLEVVGDDGPRALGGHKQRALLALLLLRANEVVSTDAIVEALWSGEPPPTASAYVQNCVSRLRKSLGPEVLETRPPGYLLRVREDAVDARRFERLVREAHALPAQGRAASVREALALWRGSPLSDLAYEPFAQAEIRRLGELRLSALEARIEAELELGLHAELVGELEALAREYPAQEGLRRLQMLALYRAGRQVDALAAYQETRLALVEEYGVEPSEGLRALERMILTHDTSLDLAAQAPAPEAPAPVREVRKTVTVLFADLADSTGLGERLDPESLRRLMSRVLAELRTAIELHEGTVERFAGDDVMAVFGVPRAHEDDAARALRAAVRMREVLAALSDEVALQWGVRLALRTGVNTGEVMAGGAGYGQPFVTGDAVNVAKRIHQAAAPGEILMGTSTHQLAGGAVTAEAVDAIEARGRSMPIEAYRVTGLADALVARRFEAPLVGRAKELAQLRSAVNEVVREGACRKLLVVGEPGIGKSRLAAELVSSIQADVRFVTGRCVAYGEGATYLPLVDVLNQAAPGGGELRERVSTLLVGASDADIVAERLGATAGSGAAASSAEISWAARRFVETFAREHPLLVVFEDVHWAESTFLDLLEYLAGWTEAPVLLLCLARPEVLEARPQWSEGALSLGPLTDDEARALVAALPGGQALDESLDDLLDSAGGVPLFLEQLAALATESTLEAPAVPASVEALIASRLDRLDPWERGILDRAAVAGREFWRGAVHELSPENERASLGPRLLALARRRLVRPDRSALPREDGFRFHHALIRDVAYAAIPKGERARLHERLARWLDARESEHDELVGYHLEQAAHLQEELGDADSTLAEEAGRRLGEAGMRAFKRTDHRAAANLLARAIALLPEHYYGRIELECELGTAIKFCGDAARAEGYLADIVDRAHAWGDRRTELRARIELASLQLNRGVVTTDEVVALVEEAAPVFDAAGDELSLGRAWHVAAVVAESEAAAVRAEEHYRNAGIGPDWTATLFAVAVGLGTSPAPQAIERCHELLAKTVDPGVRSFVLPILAQLEAMTGAFDVARAYLDEARIGRDDFADHSTIATSWTNIAARVELLAGDPVAAERILRPACNALRRSGDHAWLATNLATLAEAVYRQSRRDEALELTAEALERAPRDDALARCWAHSVRAKALACLGNAKEAEQHAYEAVGLLADHDWIDERGRTLADVAEVLELCGRTTEAAKARYEALALFEAKGNVVAAERAQFAGRG